MLQLGSKGPEVKALQEKLIARGYNVGSYGADGDFGQGTHDAVMRFQRDKGLAVDGIVGPDTMRAIDGSIGTTILRKGDKGPAVKELQNKLISKGYSVGSYGADGDFGQGTHDAVMRFQRDNRLDADGVVGPATWSILNGFSNGSLLKKGDKGAEVKKLQEKLIARGYTVGSYGADGDFGQGTHDAVMKFQRDNGLAVDGVVGPATWEILNGVNGNLVLRKGDKGPEVKSLQEKLIARGYSVGSYGADGDFGQGTHDAVMRFQRDNGLDADGVAGPKTFYALNANPSGTLLRLGSKGEEVRNLQERLIARGYSVGSYGADGDFGQSTHDAVVKFQRDNGLDADGVVGRATWAALGTNDTLLRLGSKGPEVKRLQEKLISKGYSVGSAGADGDFGQGTHDAVMKFQRDNGLSADGVVGPATWSALNGFGDWNPGIGGVAGVKKMLNVAKSQLGVKEVPVNITQYGKWYGMNGVAWCAIFVSWCANQGGILGNLVPKFHWCATGVNWFKARGRYMTRSAGTPQSGDVIFFYTSKDAFYHVGIVDYVANGKVYTIEGNSDDAVRTRSYSLTDSRIHGYGRNGGIVDVPNIEKNPFLTVKDCLVELRKTVINYGNAEGISSITRINNLMLDYLRHYHYNSYSWTLSAGAIDPKFIQYVQTNLKSDKKTILDLYIKDKKEISDGGNIIDLAHMAATARAYIHSTPLLPTFWTGWGGDLSTAIGEITYKSKQYNKSHSYIANEIIAASESNSDMIKNNLTFGKADFYSDIDAIYFKILAFDYYLDNLFEKYYLTEKQYKRRLHFIKQDPSIESITKEGIKKTMTGVLGFNHPIKGATLEGLSLEYQKKAVSKDQESINVACEAFSNKLYKLEGDGLI